MTFDMWVRSSAAWAGERRGGVERLEKGREASRELEQSHLSRVLDRGGKNNNEMRLVEG